MRELECKQCGGVMRKDTITSGNFTGILFGLILIIVGVVVFIAFPVVGWILGPLIALVGLFQGGKRRKVWKCRECSTVVDRG